MSATGHIVQALATNFVIATAKLGAAILTGSGAMLAETLHSYADCGNQVLLLLGVRAAARQPDATHPLGYGRDLYFWSFMVSLILFTGGGVFSVYEGLHKMEHPEPIENVGLAFGILGFSLALEGWGTWGNIKELNARRKSIPFFKFLRETKDSDLVVVFGENSAASVGLACAMLALFAAWVTGNSMWDGAGSLAIGIVLIGVAIFLAVEVKSLLVGESADSSILAAVNKAVLEHPDISDASKIITLQQGPGEVMVLMKVLFTPTIPASRVAVVVNELEAAVRSQCPEVRWCYVEPGVPGET